MRGSFATALVLAAAALLAAGGLFSPARGAAPLPPPLIDHIEIIEGLATVHFGTDPGRAYSLHASDDLSFSNSRVIFSVRALPFFNHYVIADELTNRQRFYRLSASP